MRRNSNEEVPEFLHKVDKEGNRASISVSEKTKRDNEDGCVREREKYIQVGGDQKGERIVIENRGRCVSLKNIPKNFYMTLKKVSFSWTAFGKYLLYSQLLPDFGHRCRHTRFRIFH